MIATSSLALLLVLAETTTIFNTTIVKVDRAGRTIAVLADAGAEGGADRNRTRQLVVASSAAASLATLKAGAKVLLTLRGDTVVDIKLSAGSGDGRSSTPARPGGPRPPGASSPTHRGVPQLPASADPPQGRPVPQVAPAGGLVITGSPSPQASPVGVVPRPAVSPVAVLSPRPAVSPVAVGSPRSPGTPKPVVLPSDPPPTPIP
jgi:hypothetical protein